MVVCLSLSHIVDQLRRLIFSAPLVIMIGRPGYNATKKHADRAILLYRFMFFLPIAGRA